MYGTSNYSTGPVPGLENWQLSHDVDDYLTLSSDMTSFMNMDLVEEVKDSKKSKTLDENMEKNQSLIMEVEDFLQSVSNETNDDPTPSNNVKKNWGKVLEDKLQKGKRNTQLYFDLASTSNWLLQPAKTTHVSGNMRERLDGKKLKTVPSRRPSPYPKEKVERKRAQNRTAAFKYREKKKAENEAVDGELFHLQQRNSELKKYSYNLEIELKCLKQLMEETGMMKTIEVCGN